MTKQVSIRSERAHALATKWAGQKGRSITSIIEEALEAFDKAQDETREKEIAERRIRWRAALEQDWAALRDSKSDFKIEDMYDEDGLPC